MDAKQVAAKRGWQTLADGAIVVAIVAGILPLIGAVTNADSWGTFAADWAAWTWGIFQSSMIALGTAVVAWLRRRFIDHSGIDGDPT